MRIAQLLTAGVVLGAVGIATWTLGALVALSTVALGVGVVFLLQRQQEKRALAEAERFRMEQKVLDAHRLESLSLIAGGVVHDFNNLLTGILGNTALAASELGPDHPTTELLDEVEAAACRASDLAAQLLAYAGTGHVVEREADLGRMIQEMLPLLRASIPKSVTIEVDAPEEPVIVVADAGQLRRILMNPILNGAEAIEGTGSVQVRIRNRELRAEELSGTFAAADLPPGPYAIIEIRDDGVGMDASVRSQIFEPFFTTKAAGRGLGLTAMMGSLRVHEATATVSSSPGEGTTLTIAIPARPWKEGRPPAPPPAPRPVARSHTEEILVVEDEADVRKYVARVLRKARFTVAEAQDGIEALDLLDARADEYSVVVMDLTMPRMSGLEAVRAMRARGLAAPVVLMSGFQPQLASELDELESVTFLHKPFAPAVLMEQVHKAMRMGAAARSRHPQLKLS